MTLTDECLQLRHYIAQSDSQQLVSNLNPITLCMELSSEQLTLTFPNVDTALRMFLCIPIANCSGERSFSARKRLKNYLRSTIGQQRMDSLSLLTMNVTLQTLLSMMMSLVHSLNVKLEKNNYNKLEI